MSHRNIAGMTRFRFSTSICAAALAASCFTSSWAREDRKPAVLAPALQKFVDDSTLSGAVLLVTSPDKVLALETVGSRDLESKEPMKEDAMFWIASMTKPMTAMGLMMLVEEGKLSIDDPVEKHLPEFKGQMLVEEKSPERVVLKKPQRPVTVKDLLTHTSGLIGDLPGSGSLLDTLTLQGAVVGYAISPLQFEPGSKWQYCNPGINTLGRLIEVKSGMPFAQFMQERFFEPLGMKDTTFWPTEEQMKRVATSYKPGPEGKGLEATTVKYLNPNLKDRHRMPLAAGGLFSTAADLAKMYQMVLNGGHLGKKQYLKEETLKLMTTNQTGDLKVSFSDGMHMGLGFHIVNTPMGVTEALSPGSFGHGGAYGTQAWIDPVRKIAIVLLIQRAGLPNSDKSDMRAALQRAAVDAFGKPPAR
ncbi:MAG TPA: serine hydrolase domain-containing protein [Candidatus Saccharimonadia bacterium]|nr:serine hydrolase domain-containing protein [Candidatus Saccharimonadia bacterium]